MKCPLIKKRAELEEGYEYDEPLDCLKEECVWWIESEKQCSITVLALEASYKLWDRDRPKGVED